LKAQTDHRLYFHRIDKYLRKENKLTWLEEHGIISGVDWNLITPDDRHTWLMSENSGQFASLIALASKSVKAGKASNGEAIFRTYSPGVNTGRDSVVYDFHRQALTERISVFCDNYNSEVDRYKRRSDGKKDVDTFVDYSEVKWSEHLKNCLVRLTYATFDTHKIHECLYRPFNKENLYYDSILNDRPGLFQVIFPTVTTAAENRAISITNLGSEKPFMTLSVGQIVDYHLVGAGCGTQCFPFYVYDEDGSNRRENITDWALKQFRTHYDDKKIGKWDIFHYVYGVLHHPGYREKFADNLKRELPRIPFAPDFRAFATAGAELARLHLDYEKLEPYSLKWLETPDVPLSYRVEDKMRLNKDKTALTVNPSLTLADIPPETFQYRLGNRSALEWVIDQYQVSEDKRSGIRSDPNRSDDPEYIVRLVGQVVRVSLETVRIIAGLPLSYSD
jgi:predicted helicase